MGKWHYARDNTLSNELQAESTPDRGAPTFISTHLLLSISVLFSQSILLFWIDRQPIISCGVKPGDSWKSMSFFWGKQIGAEHVQLGHSCIIACVKRWRNDGSAAVETSPLTKLMSMITTWSRNLIIYQSVTWMSLSRWMYVDKSCRYRPHNCNFLRRAIYRHVNLNRSMLTRHRTPDYVLCIR